MSMRGKQRVKKRVKYLYKTILESDIDAFNLALNKFGEQGYKVRRVAKLHVGWWALMQKRIWVKEEEADADG